jgi:hypothetical protein
LPPCPLRRQRQESVQLRIPRFDSLLKICSQLARRNLLRRQRFFHAINGPTRGHALGSLEFVANSPGPVCPGCCARVRTSNSFQSAFQNLIRDH